MNSYTAPIFALASLAASSLACDTLTAIDEVSSTSRHSFAVEAARDAYAREVLHIRYTGAGAALPALRAVATVARGLGYCAEIEGVALMVREERRAMMAA